MQKSKLIGYMKWFKEYSRGFLVPGIAKDVALKIGHTMRVVGEITRLGESLGLAGPDLRLARAIALFHDVGRFPQLKRYKTMRDDRSENHAALGVAVLKEEGLLEGMPEETRVLITKAVGLHNVRDLPGDLPERELFYARLIRDADKLDIWRVLLDYYENGSQDRDTTMEMELPDTPGFSGEILSGLNAGRVPDFASVKNFNDAKLMQMSWAFDLNFGPTRSLVLKRRYMERIAARLPGSGEIEDALDRVTSYLKETATEGGR
jgi:putative nucleotidyltransferase with HDIG domain